MSCVVNSGCLNKTLYTKKLVELNARVVQSFSTIYLKTRSLRQILFGGNLLDFP